MTIKQGTSPNLDLEGTFLNKHVAQSDWLEEQCLLSSFFFLFSRWRNGESSVTLTTPRRHEAALHLEIGDHGWLFLPSLKLQSSIPNFSALLHRTVPESSASSALLRLSSLPPQFRRRQFISDVLLIVEIKFAVENRRIQKARETSMATFGYFAHPVLIV